MDKAKTKNKKRVKLEINKPAMADLENEDVIFQRVLGHFEIPFAHRWVETTAAQCHICQKLTYTVFTWNKRIAEELSRRKQHTKTCENQDALITVFNQSKLEPIRISKYYDNPILCVDNKIIPFLPLNEFVERLTLAVGVTVRNCNNEIEKQRFEKIGDIVKSDVVQNRKLDLTYWQQKKSIVLPNSKSTTYKLFEGAPMSQWYRKLTRLLPQSASEPIPFESLMQLASMFYKQSTNVAKDIAEDTYMCAAFLPSKDIDFIIKHKDIPGVNYLRKKQSNEKHMSINRITASEKRIRKIKEIKHFSHASSVFKDFIPETEGDLNKAFDMD